MISAKNYAAQAQRALREYAQGARLLGPRYLRDAANVDELAASIEQAVHFALPDGGMLMDDNLRGLSGTMLRLPYPAITVEYYVPRELGQFSPEASVHSPRRLLYAEEVDAEKLGESIADASGFVPAWVRDSQRFVFCAVAYEVERWLPAIATAYIPTDWDQHGNCGAVPIRSLVSPNPVHPTVSSVAIGTLCPGLAEDLVADKGDDLAEAMMWTDIAGEVRALHELIEALSCVNVGMGLHQGDGGAANARRVRNGKLPLWETKCLMVEAGGHAAQSGGQRVVGRAGPRQHLRRGHIRRIPSGRNVWVQACVVGNAGRGWVEKSYAVR